ncbi:hypothetical protein ACKWTF_010657 [Chironomus riparius]
MHIENPDALKSWLTPVLEPLCDADPTALAKYVLALLKKDKPQIELTGCMAEQLDVFLGKETKPFLDKLFSVIQNQEYITVSSSDKNQNVVVANPIKERETTPPVITSSQSSNNTTNSSGGIKRTKESADEGGRYDRISTVNRKTTSVTTPSKSKSQEPISKTLTDANNRDMRRRRISNRSKSRSKSKSRSRSKSLERIRRSRSRERRLANNNDYVRDKQNRSYRNLSPQAAASAARRYDHRKNDRVSPKPYRGNLPRRSRSRSMSPTYRKISPKPEEFPFENKSKRCRDFDEKGYCMRGETCPWDHGVDPVVLEDLNNPQIGMAPVSLNIRAPHHTEYNPDNPDLWNRSGPGFPPSNRMMLPGPRPPYFGGFRGGPGMFNMPPTGSLPRELISVPVMDPNVSSVPGEMAPQMKRRFDAEEGAANNEGPKRKLPINARLGPRINSGMPMNPQANCSLELRKIPRGLNAISHLNDHFSKFGKITNIQIAYETDPEAAIVTFSTHAEANVAYRSTEAVLNNRFIKVFWHTGNGANSDNPMSGAQGSLPKPSELSMRRFPYTPNNQPSANQQASSGDNTNQSNASQSSNNNSNNINNNNNSQDSATTSSATTPTVSKPSTTFVSSATIAAQQAAQQQRLKAAKLSRATNEMIKKKQKEQQKEVYQIAHGLLQKKQELVQKNVSQMKQLFDKLEKTDPMDPARGHLMDTIKSLQMIIDKMKLELESESAQIVQKMQTTTPPQRKTKEQQQKELLDCELELISKEQHGDNDTYAIQKRYLELQKSLNRPHFAAAGPRPQIVRPTIARFGSTSVDRRPTTLEISGFNMDESDAVLGHFKHFGEITKNVLDEKVPCLVLSYSNRINAEQALARGRQFKDKALAIKWFTEKVQVKEEATEMIEKAEDVGGKSPKYESVKLEKKEGSDDEEMEEEERSWRRGYEDGE